MAISANMSRSTSTSINRLVPFRKTSFQRNLKTPSINEDALNPRKDATMIERILLNKLYDSNKTLTDKAIQSRLSQARSAEKILGYSLDYAVSTNDRMYESLSTLKGHDTKGNLQNALRWYYKAKLNKEFPRLSDYELIKRAALPVTLPSEARQSVYCKAKN